MISIRTLIDLLESEINGKQNGPGREGKEFPEPNEQLVLGKLYQQIGQSTFYTPAFFLRLLKNALIGTANLNDQFTLLKDIRLEAISKDVGNLSFIHRLTFEFSLNKEQNCQQISFICKVPTTRHLGQHIAQSQTTNPASEYFSDHDKLLEAYKIFLMERHNNEIRFYKNIGPLVGDIVPLPKLYDCQEIIGPDDLEKGFLLLEDVGVDGTMPGIQQPLNKIKLFQLVELLAIFHARTMCIFWESPQLKNIFNYEFTEKTKKLADWFKEKLLLSLKVKFLNNKNEASEELFEQLAAYNLMDFTGKSDNENKEAMLCHGDFGSNNFFFKNGQNDIYKIIDWQFAHIGNGLVDVAQLIIRSAEFSLMKADFVANLLSCYEKKFNQTLNVMEISMPILQIGQQFRRSLPYGLLFSLLSFINQYARNGEQFEEEEEIEKQMLVKKELERRIAGGILFFDNFFNQYNSFLY